MPEWEELIFLKCDWLFSQLIKVITTTMFATIRIVFIIT